MHSVRAHCARARLCALVHLLRCVALRCHSAVCLHSKPQCCRTFPSACAHALMHAWLHSRIELRLLPQGVRRRNRNRNRNRSRRVLPRTATATLPLPQQECRLKPDSVGRHGRTARPGSHVGEAHAHVATSRMRRSHVVWFTACTRSCVLFWCMLRLHIHVAFARCLTPFGCGLFRVA